MHQYRPRRALLTLLFLGLSLASRPAPEVAAHDGIALVSAGERVVLRDFYVRQAVRGMSQLVAQDLFQVRLTSGNTSAWQQTQASRSPRWSTTR